MATSGALELTIAIAGKIDPSLAKSINSTTSMVDKLTGSSSKFGSMAANLTNAMGAVGKAGLAAVAAFGATTTAIVAKSTSAAQAHEDHMQEVAKYIDGITDSTGNILSAEWEKASNEILKISTQLPMTEEELSRIAANLGQSGKSYAEIFGSDGVSGYLKDAATVAAAWDITADEAADYTAKWENAFGKSHSEIMALADDINYLGGNFATTSAEIASVVNEVGGVGQVAGASLETTAAIATSMLASGVSADSAGTTLKNLYTRTALGKGATSAMKTAWNELGFSAEGVAQSMQMDAAGTLQQVFSAIGNASAADQTYYIKTLFGNYAIEGISKLISNPETLTSAMALANDSSGYTGSMDREMVTKLSTSEAVSQMAGNATDRLLIQLGKSFLPVQKELAALWIDITNGITENLPDISNVVDALMPLFVDGVKAIGNALQGALPFLQTAANWLANFITNENGVGKIAGGVGVLGLMSAAPSIYGAVSSAGGLLSTLGNTVIGARPSGAPGGTVGGFTLNGIAKALNPFTMGSRAATAVGNMGGMKGLLANAKGAFSLITEPGANGKTTLGSMASNAATLFGGGIANSGLGKYVSGIANAGSFGGQLAAGLGPIASALGSGFLSLLGTFGPIIAGVGGVIAVVSILGDNIDNIGDIIENTLGEGARSVFDGFVSTITGIGTAIQNALSPEGLAGIQDLITNIFGEGAGNAFGTFIPLIESVTNIFGQIVDLGVNHIKPIILEIFDFTVNQFLPAVIPLLSTIITAVGTTLVNAVKVIIDIVNGLLPIVEPVITGITNLIRGIVTIVANVANAVIEILNGMSFTVPDWVPKIGGTTFGFNLTPITLPQFANGGWTNGPTIAGEAGTEAVISMRRSERARNIELWRQAGEALGVSNIAAAMLGSDLGVLVSDTATAANYVADLLEGSGYLNSNAAQRVVRGLRETDAVLAGLGYSASMDGLDLSGMTERISGESGRGYTSGEGNVYQFAPVINVYGGQSENDISRLMDSEYEKFCAYMEKYERTARRRAYAV